MRLISKKLRDSARGQQCTLRLDGCLYSPETVVLCHVPGTGMKGTGMKTIDVCAVFGCDNCHSIIDGRKRGEWSYKDIVRALAETWVIWLDLGLITYK
jgi:hypothetical protein